MDDAGRSSRLVRILVVDDEPDIRDVLAEVLEGAAADVFVQRAGSGPEALDLLSNGHVDLILTDFRMPGMDGLAFLARARRIAPRTPAIMMTAYPDVEMAIAAVNEQRVSRFLPKPFDAPRLLRAVEEVLAQRDTAAREARRVAEALRQTPPDA